MFSKIWTNKSMSASSPIERLKQALDTADAILIGAGAGMSTSAGLTYSGERFEKYFSDFAQKYGIRDIYSGGFYPFETREEYYDFILANDPAYFERNKPAQILDTFARDLDEWIDWESNRCHFDDGSFAALLEFCKQGRTQEDGQEYFSVAIQFEEEWGRKQKANSFVLEDGVESYRFTDVKKALEYQKTLPAGKGAPMTKIERKHRRSVFLMESLE